MSSPVKEVLQSLSRYAEVVEQGIGGVISTEAGTPASSIAALRQSSALRPAGEEGYRLHPRLREYLQDHLQMYPAYQSLAEIGSRIRQIQSLWDEIEVLAGHRDHATVNYLVDQLHSTIFEIC